MKYAVLALLLSASNASAWDGPGWSPWTFSLQEDRDGMSYNAEMRLTRQGKAWRVEGSCTVYDLGTKAWLTQRGTGLARRSEQGLKADVTNLNGFFVNKDSVVFGTMLCPSVPYNLGTGEQ